MTTHPLTVAIVGVRGMGLGHARAISTCKELQLIAGCDLVEERLKEFTEKFPGSKGYTSYERMLLEAKPDIIVVVTNNITHAPLTIQAAEAGVKGVYCEKPMTTNLADAYRMVQICREKGVALAVNHQRRLSPTFQTLRRVMEEGIIGDVELIRASCAGDILSDGTHLVDTVRHLVGDIDAKWVFAQIYRDQPNIDEPKGMGYDASGGWRYGHPIETGGMAVVEFVSGVRAEFFTHSIQPRGRAYQDYEIFGTNGRIHRAGDGANPQLMLQSNDQAGWRPIPIGDIPVEKGSEVAMVRSYQLLAKMIEYGEVHPLSGDSALKDMEMVMGMYESARLRQRLTFPITQMRFPLEIMVENGEM